MRNNMGESKVMRSKTEIDKVMFDEAVEVTSMKLIDEEEEEWHVSYRTKKAAVKPHATTNVYIAAFVTAFARHVLYRQLDHLGESVLYHDTDSAYYISSPRFGVEALNAGEGLGDWEDDLDAGSVIVGEWNSLGKKTYCFQQRDADGTLRQGKFRLKGFALSAKMQQTINHDSMSRLVRDSLEAQQVGKELPTLQAERQSQICRNKKTAEMTTVLESAKKLQLVYDSGTVVAEGDGNFRTLPFGYRG